MVMVEVTEIAEKIILGQISMNESSILVDKREFSLHDVNIAKSTAPVKKPTMRGGVYFANVNNYKLSGTVTDFDILPMLSGKMLGPNTDFAEIPVTAEISPGTQKLVLITNLTDMMQNSKKIVLNMVIVRAEIS